MPFLFSIGIVKAQPSLALPKTTFPVVAFKVHSSLNLSGATSLMTRFTSLIIPSNRSITSCGGNFNSRIRRSTLLMNNTGLHHSSPTDRRMLVSVCVITPSSASTSKTAPSLPLSARLTSPVKLM